MRVCCACMLCVYVVRVMLCVVRVYSSTCGRPDLTSVVLCYSDMNTSSYKCVRACMCVLCVYCMVHLTPNSDLESWIVLHHTSHIIAFIHGVLAWHSFLTSSTVFSMIVYLTCESEGWRQTCNADTTDDRNETRSLPGWVLRVLG